MRKRLEFLFLFISSHFLNSTATFLGVLDVRGMIYLTRYGYAETHQWSNSLDMENSYKSLVNQSVMDFQEFARLTPTGVLDETTVEMMKTPRCGVKDIVGKGNQVRRRKRYAIQGSDWKKFNPNLNLTYKVSSYPTSSRTLTRNDVDKTVAKAFGLWADASRLEFTNVRVGDADIEIMFSKFEHGDGDPFDGPGGTLAHAYFPEFGGDVHLDDSENWTVDTREGTNLLQTLTHEIGHSLGLSHSDDRESVMGPFYKGYDPDLSLTQDDIIGIQRIYGENTQKSTPKPSPAPTNNELCNSKIDAIFKTANDETFVFKNDEYWKLTSDSIASGYPRQIASHWGGQLPNNIDAAFTWERKGVTYIFKGDQYWKYTNMNPEPNYPKKISEGFPGIPNNIDSVFVWGGNGKIYFTKGDKFWKFDPDRKPHVSKRTYPKFLSLWGLPDNIEGAFQWTNRLTYFFKDGKYWRYDDVNFRVADASPRYPRDAGQWWFGCNNEI